MRAQQTELLLNLAVSFPRSYKSVNSSTYIQQSSIGKGA